MQPDINPNRVAPPSYAEAMGQTTAMKDNDYVSPSGQMSSYLPSISGYQHQSNFYPVAGAQPPYNLTYAPGPAGQQNPASSVQCIVHTERVVHRKRCKDRYCSKKVSAAILCFIVLVVIIRWLIIRS